MTNDPNNHYLGECTCGLISLELALNTPLETHVARVCGCSFCGKYEPRYVSDPKGLVIIKVSDWDHVNVYKFGLRGADFLICSRCEVFVVATCKIETEVFAVTNINCLAEPMPDSFPTRSVNFEKEDAGQRLNRRKLTWTPAVVTAKPETIFSLA